MDTGEIDADGVNINGLELALSKGSLIFSSEAMQASVFKAGENLNFWGAYAACGWMLTGETRPYLRDKGIFGQVIPRSSFSNTTGGSGAIELAFRCSYLNLSRRRYRWRKNDGYHRRA